MYKVVIGLLVITGCAGEITGDPGSGGPDASVGGGGGPDAANGSPDAAVGGGGFACRNPVAQVGSGQHNAGQDCNGGCHNHGFTLAGTLFASVTGATPMVGATITIVDANNATVDVVSQRNGNFYTSQALTFPVKVTASSCPNVAPMSATVAQANSGCNKSGCHAAGGQGQIHLP